MTHMVVEKEKAEQYSVRIRPSTRDELFLMKQEIEMRADRSLTLDAFFNTLTSNSDWIIDTIAENVDK